MTQVSSINAATTAAQAAQAGGANVEAGNTTTTQSDVSKLGLPPSRLAQAASTNTVNAALVSSQWGIDPASVAGVYGGAAAGLGGLFAGDNLLPLLQSLSPATAERALALIGISTPTPSATGDHAAAYSATAALPTTTAQAISPNGQAALDQAAAGSAPTVVDPLWGRSA